MIIYLIVFFISYFFSLIAQKINKLNSLFILFSILAILLPSLLAGLRDTTVGIDVEGYAVGTFQRAVMSNSLKDYFVLNESRFEPLYLLYNYVISRFTNNIFWVFFVQQFFTLSLVYSFAAHFRNKFSISLFYLMYLLFFFNESLNIVRQTFAIAVIIYSFRFLFEKRIVLHYACMFVAFLFHYSSVIVFFLYPLYWWLYNMKSDAVLKFTTFFILIVSFCIYIFYKPIVSYGIYIGLINSFYDIYINQVVLGFNITEKILVVILWVISRIIDILNSNNIKKGNDIITVFTIICIALLFLGEYNIVAHRIAIYFVLMEFVILLVKLFESKSTLCNLFSFCLFSILLIRWIHYAYTIDGYSGTIPYSSLILSGII